VGVHTKLIVLGGGGTVAALLLAGCVAQENDRLLLGRSVQLEAFYPPAPAQGPTGAPVLTEQSPTLTGIIRTDWEPMPVLVPVDGTAHRPVYNKQLYLADASARQRREYPTALNALELSEGSETDQQLEAAGNLGLAVADLILLVPRLVLQPPWRTEWSPKVAYDRYWYPAWTPAVVQGEVVAEPPLAPNEERPAAGEDVKTIELHPAEPR
jgi:hypothetical protein